MSLLNQIIGAVVAEEALQKADPDAGLLKEGLAAVAGFEGEKVIEEKIDELIDNHKEEEQQDSSQN